MGARIIIENVNSPKLWKTINLEEFSDKKVAKIVRTYASNKNFKIVG